MSAPGKPGRPRLEDVSEYDAEAEILLNEYKGDITLAVLGMRYGLSIDQVHRRIARARKNRSAGVCEHCGSQL